MRREEHRCEQQKEEKSRRRLTALKKRQAYGSTQTGKWREEDMPGQQKEIESVAREISQHENNIREHVEAELAPMAAELVPGKQSVQERLA